METVFNRDANGYVTDSINTEWVFEEPTVVRRQYSGVTLNLTKDGWKFLGDDGWVAVYPFDNSLWGQVRRLFGNHPPIESPFDHVIEFEAAELMFSEDYTEGLYELVGPGISDNADGFEEWYLINHDDAEQLSNIQILELHRLNKDVAFTTLQEAMAPMRENVVGAVFTTKNGNVAQLKVADFDWENYDG